MKHSSELIKFISNINILGGGEVPVDMVGEGEERSSNYTPEFFVSSLARIMGDIIDVGGVETIDRPLEEETIVRKVLDSDLSLYAPDIYLLVRVVVLESFALLYHINNNTE